MIKNCKIKVENDGYFVASNEIYRNKEISARAKGLHGFLRSNSDTFDTSVYELYTFFKEGRDAICSAFRELENWGYITKRYTPIVLDDGRKVRRVDYTVHAVSKLAANGLQGKTRNKRREKGKDRHRRRAKRGPKTDFQETENQGPENQGPENPCANEETTRSEKQSSVPENVEGRDAGASESSQCGADQKSAAGGPPAPSSGPVSSASDGDRGSRKRKTAQKATKTPENAPWAGKSYSGITRDQLNQITSYEDFWGWVDNGGDPVLLAMHVTGETMSGGYGHWIKWLNSVAAALCLESAINVFVERLEMTWAECRCDAIKNPAAIFNLKLAEFMKLEVAA